MDIIQAVLDANPTAYTDQRALFSLAEKLGVAQRAAEISLRASSTALRTGDVATAQRECLALVKAGHRPAWELAGQLALLGVKGGLSEKDSEALTGFALAHCPLDKVGGASVQSTAAPLVVQTSASPRVTLLILASS